MGRNRAFSLLGHERSLHERHGDRGLSKDIRRSPFGYHLVAKSTESHQMNQVGSPLGVAMATSLANGDLVQSKAWSPLMVALATLMLQVATSLHLQGRHLWSPWRPRGASGDLYTNCSWSPLAKWRERWFSWRPSHLTVLRSKVAIATK